MKDFLTILIAGLAILGVLLLWPSQADQDPQSASMQSPDADITTAQR